MCQKQIVMLNEYGLTPKKRSRHSTAVDTPPKRQCRESTLLRCQDQGGCHRKNCNYQCDLQWELNEHQSTEKFMCTFPGCIKVYGKKRNLNQHCHKKHPGFLPPAKPTTKTIPMPSQFVGIINTAIWQFLKNMVHTNIFNDIYRSKKKLKIWMSAADKAKLLAMNNNETKHRITEQLVQHMINKGMFGTMNVKDDNGGILPHGFTLRYHGGLYKASFDRKRDNIDGSYCLHYPDPENALLNINVVALLANTRFKATYEEHRERYFKYEAMSESDFEQEFQKELAFVSKVTINGETTVLYQCANNIFNGKRKYEKCRQYFDTFQDYWQYLLELLKKQKGRCAVTNTLMLSTKNCPWRMSADAINPLLGHIPGNLRLVCVCCNPTDSTKTKSKKDKTITLTSMTTKIYQIYYNLQ